MLTYIRKNLFSYLQKDIVHELSMHLLSNITDNYYSE